MVGFIYKLLDAVTGKMQLPVTVAEAVYHGSQTQSSINNEVKSSIDGLKQKKGYINPYFESTLQVCHRGGVSFPENTMVAFENAVKTGFKYIEADVRVTKDGEFVLLHDDTIDRTSNGSGKVSGMTLQELLTYDFGSWKGSEYSNIKIPTLEEFLIFVKKNNIMAELDCAGRLTEAQMTNLYDKIKAFGALGYVNICAYESELRWLADSFRQKIAVSISLWNITPTVEVINSLGEDLMNFSSANLSIKKDSLTRTLCDAAHNKGLKVKSWTITSSSDISSLINMGCDTILVDSDTML